jgi:putative Mg2+ transporter-C (MgtC) family protein
MPGDPTRIASQIITGIGFLGAGAIIRGAGSVSGLTSAATIWFLGALGILIGCSYPITGILLAVVVVLLLSAVALLERGYEKFIRQREGTEAAKA